MASSKNHVAELEKETMFAGKVSSNYQGNSMAGNKRTVFNRLGRQEGNNNNNDNLLKRQAGTSGITKCNKCGMIHQYRCPAKGTECYYCGKTDHFARMCTKLVKKKLNYAQNIEFDSDDEQGEDLFTGSVTITNVRGKPKWSVELAVTRKVYLLK